MTTTTKIKQLQDILSARLPTINRWNSVEVTADDDYFYIRWSAPKEKNIHPHETKEVPLKDIDEIIKRNTERLYNSVKMYK